MILSARYCNIIDMDMTEQARENLGIIIEQDKEDEFEQLAIEWYGEATSDNGETIVNEDALTDALHNEWEEIFEHLGIKDDKDDEDDEDDEKEKE